MLYDTLNKNNNDTICAAATASGAGAISVIRVSGPKALAITEKIFKPANPKRSVINARAQTILFGSVESENALIDEVLLSIFRKPHSYTGEDAVEISCHASPYIQQRILELLVDQGARAAKPGEFTFRAFKNQKLDLSQAEAVADLIASNSSAAHSLALEQMRGGYSKKIKQLRQKLIEFTSLIELELDFSEEDVEFANRKELMQLLDALQEEIEKLIESFRMGNVLKHGIPVAIIGKPNVGKSTLLNAILNEEKAIVSEIPGTTRDVIEDTILINGHSFRFIDTAGLREAKDEIESIGIERSREKIQQAGIILYVFDVSTTSIEEIESVIEEYKEIITHAHKEMILIANKIDNLVEIPHGFSEFVDLETIFISAKRKENIHEIAECLKKRVDKQKLTDNTIISNIRHYEALNKVLENINKIKKGFIDSVPPDLLSIDIKEALYYLGLITGEITNDEILNTIFGKFCIGK